MTLIFSIGFPAFAVADTKDPLWDVEQGKWYYKDINEVFARDLIRGKEEYGKVSFKPNDQVTQVEALIMVLRYLDKEQFVNNLTDAEVDVRLGQIGLKSSDVLNWAKKHVAYATSLGYVKSKNDATANPASREWIAQLMVRVLMKEGQAQSPEMMKATSFADDRDIPSNLKGYVNTVVELELMKGVNEYGTLKFNPKGVVSRAEMATMLLRLDKHIQVPNNYSKVVVIKELSETGIEFQTKDGKTEVLAMNMPAVFKVTAPNKSEKVQLRDIKKYDQARISVRNNKIVFVDMDGTKGELKENLIIGKFDKLDTTLKLLWVVQDAGEIVTLRYTEPLVIKDEQNRTLNSSELKKDVEVRITVADNQKDIVDIVVLGSAKNEQPAQPPTQTEITTGTFLTMDEAAKRITLELENGTFKNFTYDANTKLVYQQHRFPTLADLKAGDRVRLSLSNTTILEIEVLQLATDNTRESGIIDSLNEKGSSITIKKDDEVKAYSVATQVKIEISGMYAPTWVDLKVGHLVQLTIENGKVTKITVTGDSTTQVIKGRFIAADTKTGILNYRAENGELSAKELAANVYVEMEGIPWTITNLEKDMRISITLKDNKVTQIILDNKRQGIIKSIDATNRKLVVTHEGTDVNYTTQLGVWIDLLDKPNAQLKDLAVGQEIQFYLNTADEIKRLTVSQSLKYTVLSLDTSTKSLRVIRSGVTSTLIYNDKVQLVVAGKTNPTWEDIRGSAITVTYFGKDLVRVEK